MKFLSPIVLVLFFSCEQASQEEDAGFASVGDDGSFVVVDSKSPNSDGFNPIGQGSTFKSVYGAPSFSLTNAYTTDASVSPTISIININPDLSYEASIGSLASTPSDIVDWTQINNNHQFTGLSLGDCGVFFISMRTRDGEGTLSQVQTSWALRSITQPPSAATVTSIGSDHNLTTSPTVQVSRGVDQCGYRSGYNVQLIKQSDNSVIYSTNQSGSSFKIINLNLIAGEDYFFKIKSIDLYGQESSVSTSSTFQPSSSGVFNGLNPSDLNVNEDSSLVLTKDIILSDLSASLRSQTTISGVSVSGGSITESSADNWIYIPAEHFSGTVTMSYTLTLGSETSAQTRDIVVAPVVDSPSLLVSAFSISTTANTTANFSSETSGVVFDATISTSQTVGSQVDRWDVTSATGSSFGDTFVFSALANGDSITVTGGGGIDTLDLSQFSASQVTIDNSAGTATVNLGNSQSAVINYTSVENFEFRSDVFDGNPHSVEIISTAHNWNIVGRNLSVLSPANDDEAIAILNYNGTIDSDFNLETTVTTTNGNWANGGIIFDYQDENNFKVAVARIGLRKWSIEEMENGTLTDRAQTPVISSLARNVAQTIELRVTGQTAAIYSGGVFQVSYNFGEALNDGMIGVMVDNARTDFVVSLAPSNWSPAVSNQTVTMQQQNINHTTGNVITEAVDPEGASLSISTFTNPTNGTLVSNTNSTFTYTPNASFVGIDSFNYTISDGVNSAVATVTMDVQANATITISDGEAFKINLGHQHADNDGSETVAIVLRSLPIGTTVSDGTTTLTVSQTDTDISSLDTDLDLTIDPPNTGTGFTVDVLSTATETANSSSSQTTSNFTVVI